MACRSATYRKPAIDGAPPAPRLAALYGRQGECGALAEPRRSWRQLRRQSGTGQIAAIPAGSRPNVAAF